VFPPLAVYLFRRRTKDQPPRTRELGFLVLAASWVVFFFSLSTCKLPTYILPAFPFICLLAGRWLDAEVLSRPLPTTLARTVGRIPKTAIVISLFIALAAAIVDLVLSQYGPLGWAADAAVLVGSSVLLVLFLKSPSARPGKAWAVAAAISLAVMVFVFDEIVPEFSRLRSTHAEAQALYQERGRPPVVYFARVAHTAEFHIDPDQLQRFSSSQLKDFEQFLREHPEVIVVTTPESAKTIEDRLGSFVELKSADDRGRLYVAHVRPSPRIRVTDRSGSPPR